MATKMPLTVTDTALEIIGFNAIFNDLANIDQVEVNLYRGEPLSNSNLLTANYSELCKQCANVVVEANNLSAEKIALIVVDNDKNNQQIEGADHAHFSYQHVENLSDALHQSALVIQKHDVAVLIICASLPAEVSNSDKSTISFDSEFNGYAQLQGVACVLLSSEYFVKKNNSHVYSTISNVVSGDHAEIETVFESSLNAALVNSTNKISTLEVSACSDNELQALEQKALINAYNRIYENSNKQATLSTAVSCQKSVLGENNQLSEIMSLIYSNISLQQRYRPAIKDWFSPQKAMLAQWQNSAFYYFNQAAPVFPDQSGQAKINAVSLINEHNVSHIVLTEAEDGQVHQNGYNNHAKQSLIIIGANDETNLLNKVEQLDNRNINDIKALAKEQFLLHKNSNFAYTLVLIAESVTELKKEIKQSLIGIKNAFEKNADWKTPKGSYFTSMPDKSAKTAFLYPGIGATYIGLGRELIHLFPEIYPSVIAIADNIGASLKDELLNPRSVTALDFKTLQQLDLDLRNSLANIAECGVGYACVFTKIFEQVFNIKADFAGGYSMGEISMFAALGCWQTPGLMSARLAHSDTFNHQLSCELRAVRKLWNLPDIEDGEFEQIWETYSIKGTVEQISAQIRDDERVFITIVNTPDSLVIGGFPADCLAFIKRIGVRAMPLKMANAIHSAPAYQEYDKMLALYNMPVTERIQTKMVSTSCYLPIPQHQNAISVSIAKCLCEPVDFPRLINTLAAKSVKVYIEMGAGRSLSSWTDKTLKNSNQHHITVPVNAKGTDDQLTYARAVAKLVSFGVEMNIERYFSGSLIVDV